MAAQHGRREGTYHHPGRLAYPNAGHLRLLVISNDPDGAHAGYEDTVRALDHPSALELPTNGDGVATFDAAAPERVAGAG